MITIDMRKNENGIYVPNTIYVPNREKLKRRQKQYKKSQVRKTKKFEEFKEGFQLVRTLLYGL